MPHIALAVFENEYVPMAVGQKTDSGGKGFRKRIRPDGRRSEDRQRRKKYCFVVVNSGGLFLYIIVFARGTLATIWDEADVSTRERPTSVEMPY